MIVNKLREHQILFGAAFLGCIVALFIIMSVPDGDASSVRKDANGGLSNLPSQMHVEGEERETEKVVDTVSDRAKSISLTRLISACGDMSIQPSQTCLTMLDDLFENQDVYVPLDFEAPSRSSVNFQSIFGSPALNFLESKSSLSRSECWLEEGEINFSLTDTCNARAMVHHALFSYHCGQFSGQNEGLDSLSEPVNNSGQNQFEHALSLYNQADDTPNNQMLLNYYRDAYIKLQCYATPQWVKGRLGFWKTEWDQSVRDHISLASSEDKVHIEESIQSESGEFFQMLEFLHWELEFHGLLEKASRLGDEFALVSSQELRDSKSEEIVKSLRPDVHYLHSIRDHSSPARRLELSMIAREYAAKEGWNMDVDFLWKVICRNEIDGSECSSLMDMIDHELIIQAGAHDQIALFTSALYEMSTK